MFGQINRRVVANFDWTLAAAMLMLCGLGLAIIYSAGFDPALAGVQRDEVKVVEHARLLLVAHAGVEEAPAHGDARPLVPAPHPPAQAKRPVQVASKGHRRWRGGCVCNRG